MQDNISIVPALLAQVRCRAAHCLTKVANAMVANWNGPPAMMQIFRKMFGSFSCPNIIRQHDFTSLQNYYILKVCYYNTYMFISLYMHFGNCKLRDSDSINYMIVDNSEWAYSLHCIGYLVVLWLTTCCSVSSLSSKLFTDL